MKKTIISSFLIVGATAFAASNNYKIDILQDSTIEGKSIKAGEYKLTLENDHALLKQGKQVFEVPAHEETNQYKVDATEITYVDGTNVKAIEIGGTRLKVIFDGAGSANSGM